MEDEDLVVAVRLCDTVEEVEQPDPLCLRREDLITWRHFETLLLGMYKNPPPAIRVTYLDDDSDWITIGSDIELAEAVRIIKETGDILQLQVKRVDTEELINFDSTESASSAASAPNTEAGQFTSYVSTTDPRGEVLKPLVYPHPPSDHLSNVDGPTISKPQNDLPWLVYPPHHSENSNLPMSQEITRDHWQLTTPFELSGQAASSSKDSRKLSTSSNLSTCSRWEEAASMTTEQKLKFMRGLIETNNQHMIHQAECKIQQEKDGTEECLNAVNVASQLKVVPPLCSEKGSLGMNFIPNQDPFEVNLDLQASLLDQFMIGLKDDFSPALAPKQAAASKSEASARYFRMSSLETDGAASVSFADTLQDKQISDLLVPTQASQSSTQTRAIYTSTVPKCKKGLKHAPAPIPMPRNLLIMEGAQSGANAVAIEMPSEFFSVTAVTKEEEIAASGGAANSASEETGEVMARGDSVAAAVSREIKSPSQNGEVCTAGGDEVIRHAGEKKAKRSSQKVKHSSSKRDRSSSEKKPEAGAGIGGVKPKLSEKSERRSSEHRKKQEEFPAKDSSRKDEKKVKVTEDVESGEKVNVKRETAALSRGDFAKYMKKTKKELHVAIVKDVTQVTAQYLKKAVENTAMSLNLQEAYGVQALAYHEGIYCDSCNKVITGIRYKCGNCIDFDLCSICESKANIHDPTHVFLKLRSPARGAGTFRGQTYFLLVENIYETEKRRQSVSSEHPGSECSLKMAESSHGNSECAAVPSSEQEKPAVEESQQTVDVAESGLPQERDDLLTKEAGDCCTVEETYKCPEEISHNNFSTFLTSVEKLLPSAPVEPESEDAKQVQDSPTLSDSSSSIVPVTPPTMLSPTAPAYSTEVQQNASWDYFSPACFHPEDCHIASFAGSEGDELPELLSENTVRQTERFADDDDSSSFEDMASDTSDDFCVIEAPASHRNEYEAIPGDICDEEDDHVDIAEADLEAEAHHEDFPEVSAVVEETNLGDATGLNLLDDVTAMGEEAKCESEAEEAIAEDGDNNVQGGCDEKESEREEMRDMCMGAERGVSVDGLVHTMNEEEKMRFAQLLKAEMDKEYEEELKRRAQELEKELRLQKEREFQIILEAKEKAAAFENEKLEWVTQEEERASSISRQTSAVSFRSLDRSISDDGTVGSKKDADCQTIPEPVSPASHIIHNVASGVSKAAVSAFYTAKDVFYSLQAKQTEWKSTPSAYRAPPQSDAKFVRNPLPQGSTEPTEELRQSRSSQQLLPPTQEEQVEVFTSHQLPAQEKDTMKSVQSPTIPAASHEPEVDGTSKPVKALRPGGCWVPQMSNFRFSTNDWSPPKDDYIPPTSTWTPPKREFIPPNIEWITTSKAGKVNNDAEKGRDSKGSEADDPLPTAEPLEASRRPSLMTSQKAPSLATLEIADTALRRELQGMQRLIEMGFANREKNRQLLNKFENDLEKVVQCLLQEEGEGEDSHWSFRRH